MSNSDDCDARKNELRRLSLEELLKLANERKLAWLTNSPEYWNWEDHEIIRQIIFSAETAAAMLANISVQVKLAALDKIQAARSEKDQGRP